LGVPTSLVSFMVALPSSVSNRIIIAPIWGGAACPTFGWVP
jgi:hypothetical protein